MPGLKDQFLGFFKGTFFRGIIVLVKGDAMKVVSGYVMAHRYMVRALQCARRGIAGMLTNYCVTDAP